ncbi:hypothetical protein FBU30_001072 [Linnemannia zychae]|nr:hypothetical protein FBU30_001072 [Linnemannia zychae]
MAQNITPMKEANHLKRKIPPAPQERDSSAVKRPLTSTKRLLASTKRLLSSTKYQSASTNTSSNESHSDYNGIERNSKVEDAEELSSDEENKSNEGSKGRVTRTNSKENIPGEDVERRQSSTAIASTEPLRRQIKFPGFNKEMELVLLKAINSINPFSAPYGKTADAWAHVVLYLKDDDEKGRAKGREPWFDMVNVRNCKERWLVLSEEYAVLSESLRESDTIPIIDARYIELEKAYLYEQDCLSAKRSRKNRRYHSQAIYNKSSSGNMILSHWAEQQEKQDKSSNDGHYIHFNSGFLSGTESDTSQSNFTSSQQRLLKHQKQTKNIDVTSQLTLAMEYSKQHLDFLREEGEKQRKAEESRQEAMAKLFETQTACSERIAKQQAESNERIVKQQAENTERIVKQQAENTERLLNAIIEFSQKINK